MSAHDRLPTLRAVFKSYRERPIVDDEWEETMATALAPLTSDADTEPEEADVQRVISWAP